MKPINRIKILFLLVLLWGSSKCFAQTWFPLEEGNTWMYLKRFIDISAIDTVEIYSFYKCTVISDSIISGRRYFRLENFADYSSQTLFYYNASTQKLYGRIGNTEYQIIDFSKPNNYSYYQLAPDGSFRNAVIEEYEYNYLDTTYISKGFSSKFSVFFAQGLGPIKVADYSRWWEFHSSSIIDYILTGYPSNKVFYKTQIENNLVPKEITTGHNRISGNVKPVHPFTIKNAQFISELQLEWFYQKGDSILQRDSLRKYSNFNFSVYFDFPLFERGFSLKYRIRTTDKYIQPRNEYFPDSGYYQVFYPKKTLLPHRPGNKWKYNEYSFNTTSGDSVFEKSYWLEQKPDSVDFSNKKYFPVENLSSGEKKYYRYDLNDPALYYYYPPWGEYMIDNVEYILYDSIPDSRFGRTMKVKYTSSKICESYSLNTEERTYSLINDPNSYYILKDSIGLIYLKEAGRSTILTEAYIYGRHFTHPVLDVETGSPEKLSLLQNYPNPFNPETNISFSVAYRQHVQLKVYDILGNEIAVLADEEKLPGNYEVKFPAGGASFGLASGIYICRLISLNDTQSIKIVLLK